MSDMDNAVDIGNNHLMMWFPWNPDRALNPQFSHLPDVEKFCLQIAHLTPDGKPCQSMIHFHGPVQNILLRPSQIWELMSDLDEPMTVMPSILCLTCGDRGHITNGKWVKC